MEVIPKGSEGGERHDAAVCTRLAVLYEHVPCFFEDAGATYLNKPAPSSPALMEYIKAGLCVYSLEPHPPLDPADAAAPPPPHTRHIP